MIGEEMIGDINKPLSEWTDTELSNAFEKAHGKDWFSPFRKEHCNCGKPWPCDIAILKEIMDRKGF